MTEEQKSSKFKIPNFLKPKNRNPASPAEGQQGYFSLTGMDTKQNEKPGSGSPRNKNTTSESSQSEITSSTRSTKTLDMSQSEERPRDTPMVTVENYYKEPKRAGSNRSRETSLSNSKLNSSLSNQTPPEKRKPNRAHKEMTSSKEMKKKSVELPSSPCVPSGELPAQSELVEKCKALQHELEKVKNERDQANQSLEDERAKTDKSEEDRRALIDEKEKVKKENEKLKNEMFEIISRMNHHKPEKTHQKSTDPSLPECDEGSGHHSLPEQLRAELNGEVVMQQHSSFHHKEVEQTVKAVEDKTRHLGYDVEACVSPVRSQAKLFTSREDLEKRLKKKEEEISRLKQTITELSQNIEESGCVIASQKESDEVKSLRKELARLQNENYKQKQPLSATNDALRQLQEEKASHQQQLQSLIEELSRLQGEKKTAKAKHVAPQSNVKPSQAQETSHEEELMSLREDRDRLTKENKKLEAENSKLEVSISGLLITSRQHRDRLSKEQADKQQQMEPLQKENKVLKADNTKLLKTLQDQLLTANHRIEELDVEKAEAHRQVKLLQEEIDELKAHQSVLQDQLRLANQQCDQVSAEKVQIQDRVESLQRQVTKYPGEIGKLKDKLNSANKRVTKLEEELDAAKEEIEARIQHEAKITRKFRTSAEEKGKLEKEIETLQLTQLTNLKQQLTQATASSQGLELKLQRQETHYRQLEQQLKREINELKRQNANLTRDIARRNQMRASTSPNRSGNEDRYQGEIGKKGEDVDFLVATLSSENSYLKEENKHLQSNFDDQYQMLSQKFLDSQRKVAELEQQMRDLQEQQIPHFQYQILNNKYLSSQRRVSDLEQEIRDLKERPLQPLPNQAVIQRGVGGLVNPKRQNFPPPLEFNHRVDEVERDSHSNSPRARHNIPRGGSNYEYSDGVQYGCQNIMDDRLEGNFPHVSPLDRTYRKGMVDDTPSPPLDISGSLPSPMHLPVQHSLSSDSDTSFQPNQRYIGDGINREIRHEARQYKKAVEQGVPAPDDVDESVWPFDPNLECPHCGKRFRRGQIREYRYHLDDEHSPSLM